MLRFCCENLLTFQSLAQFPSEVRANLEEPAQKSRPISRPGTSNSSRIVLDTSRIPVSIQRSASRPNSRPASAAGRRRDSQQFLMAQSAQQLEANGSSLASKMSGIFNELSIILFTVTHHKIMVKLANLVEMSRQKTCEPAACSAAAQLEAQNRNAWKMA